MASKEMVGALNVKMTDGGGAGWEHRERKWGNILMERKGEVQSIHAGHEREREKREREREKKKLCKAVHRHLTRPKPDQTGK